MTESMKTPTHCIGCRERIPRPVGKPIHCDPVCPYCETINPRERRHTDGGSWGIVLVAVIVMVLVWSVV